MENQNVNVNNTESTETQTVGTETQAQTQAQTVDTQTEKFISQSQLDEIINKKYAQWTKKAEQQAQEKAKEVQEAEKLKAMSEAERQQAEMKKQLDEFNKMKAEMAREKLLNQVTKELATRELPVEYAEYVMTTDSESTLERLNTFAEKYKADIQKEVDRQVNERLKGNTPKTGTTTTQKQSFTMEEIKKMTPQEINENWEVISKLKF